MKILHKSKRSAPPHPQVLELILSLLNTPNDSIPQVLGQIDVWRWPRSDLNAWIKVLNKFDAILEDVIRDYAVDTLQTNAFTPLTKKTVCEILRFERLLLENSTNRKMFNSYDRLNSFLFTSDLDVLVLSLNLLLRPSQQYSAQPSVSHALSISTSRLQSLAKRWPNLREYSIGLVDLVNANSMSEVDDLPAEAREVNYSFYRTDSNTAAKERDHKMETDVMETPQSTPRKPSLAASSGANTSGAVHIHINQRTLETKESMNLLADVIESHSIPEQEKFELMCRIRSATVLNKGREGDREKLIIVRLLAIAIFGHTHPEAQAQSSLFLYEPDLITHIAELLQLDRGVPTAVQTVAIAALDALARYRNKIQEVLTAVNAGVNHGILMALVRKTVADVANPQSTLPHAFVEAMLSFVTFIASHAAGGNMVVGAGLVPLLIQVIENRLPKRLPVVSKTMQLVDNVLYSFTNAFQLFCAGRGVEILVERIQYEVDLDIKEYGDEQKSRELFGSYGQLPVARAAILKHTLRSMHRMMQSSGTAEGLRGLIDSSVLKSVKKIIEFRGLFGPSVLPIAINIMATFVHNEPTSLAIIQEAGLPESFYRAIESGLEPVIEVIQAIPNAIGALCLNQAGQDQLSARPGIIPGIFSIFTSERHLKVLQDKENAVLIGTGIDELIRHHPSLKAPVFEALKSTLTKIEELGNAFVAPQDLKHWYVLSSAVVPSADEDVTMGSANNDNAKMTTATSDQQADSPEDDNLDPGDNAPRAHDNNVVSFIDVLGRFLEGLFQHTAHCKEFITDTDCLEYVGRLTALPCLPYDFANSLASDSWVQVMRTMTEVSTNETLLYLAKLVRESLTATANFWGALGQESKFLPFIDIVEEKAVEANQNFRQLVTLHIRISLLSDVFATAGYAHGRAAINLLQTLMSGDSLQVVPDLGALHRACIWENIVLKAGLVLKGIDVVASPQASPLEQSPTIPPVSLPDVDGASTTNGGPSSSANTSSPSVKKTTSKEVAIQEQNANALKHLTNGLTTSLAPFFQAVVKLFYARRNPDASQKKQILDSAAVVADVMLKHINHRNFVDKQSAYAFYSVMFGLLTILLMDERTQQNSLHTVLLLAFYRKGGLDAFFAVSEEFRVTIDEIMSVKPEDRSETVNKELMSAYGGLKIALHLILPLISSKLLFESGQTLIVMTRDKKDTDPDYFEPHNFLVRLRLASLPLLKELWEAPWLVSAPLGVSKSVVQTVLELAGAENEETKGETTIAGDAASSSSLVMGGPPVFARPTGPDESRIRQLTDMGFPRSAAERALMRTHNNVNAATELLLAHPFPLPPDPDPEPSDFNESADQDVIVPEQSNVEAEDVAADVPPAIPDPVIPPVESNDLVAQGKSIEQWREELDTARELLKAGLARQALRLVDEHPSLIFEVYAAFIRPADSHQAESVRCLMEDIKAFSPAAYDVQEQPLAMRCRLLALVLVEAPSTSSVEDGTKLMETLLALLLSTPIHVEASQQTIPKWLGAHLLVTELLLTMGDQPQAVAIPTEDEPIVPLVSPGPSFREARPIIFDFCLRLLALPDLPNDELLSVLRLFVLLTRQYDTAVQFVERQGVSLLFQRLKSSTAVGSHSYIAIILRHIMEDQSVLQHIMRQELKRFFSQPRTRIVEAGAYMRHCNAIALRDPEVFVDVSRSLCQLDQPYSTTHHIRLKIDSASSGQEPHQNTADVEETGGADMQVDLAPTHNTTSGPFESIIHFLVSEMMKNVRPPGSDVFSSDAQKPADSGVLSQDEPISVGLGVGQKPEGQQETTDAQERYLYFIMQCLTELLFSYDSCKIAFLSYSPKKRTATPSKETALKHRTVALNFLLTDLISYGSINHHADSGSRGRMMMCNWAMSVIVALCVDTASPHEPKEVSPELVSVRKFVLEAVSRAIKDLAPSEHADTRYGRLLALSDLCYRLLTVRFNASARKPHDDSPTHVAKIMLEKNFVATLTNALADVDLNYPNIRSLVVAILKPLEHLTKIAIKMSRASDRNKDSVLGKADSVGSYGSEQDEDEDVEETGREETPDLYRNSSLGMYGGEMEDVHYDPEDEMDEDDDDDNEDVEMDFGEETGSDDTSDTEGEEEEDLDEDTHESEGDWHDNDEEDEENLVEHDEDNADADGDEEGAEVGAEEEILWQDIHEDEDIQDEGDDEEEEAGEPIPIIHADEEDEVEMMSDEEDYANEMGIADPNDPGPAFSLQGIFANAPSDSRDGQPFFLPRRQRMLADDDLQIFGQNRNIPAVPPEATTHPLLLDAHSSNRVTPGQTRGSRRSRNIQGDSQAELLQTIEDLIGGGAVQLFHHIMTRSRGGGTEAIRLDIPTGAVVNLERGGGQRGSRGIISTSLRVERVPRSSEVRPAGRDFDPLLTIQRWAEEVKILHGKFVQERANRLANHVVLALLPAAKEAAREAKIKEQEAARRQEAEAAEEAKKKEKEDEIVRQQTTEREAEAKAEAEVEAEAEKGEGSSSPEAAQAEEARPPTVSPNEDALMQDVSEGSAQEVPPAVGSSITPEESTVSPPAEGGSSEVAERVMVMIHGSAVDITDTGIDPTFLEALPDDMREEVLNQHVRDQRAARIERPPDSQISSEFLDALPPEIRAEIIQQERIEQAHRLAEEVTGPDGQGATGAPSDIDPASFIASLEPQLRQVVLLDQDDGFIQTLPSHMIAEAGVYRDSSHRPRRQMMMRGGAPRSAPEIPPRKLSTPRDAIQLLEKSGIAMLVRLLFFPQVLKKNILYKVLVNLCENSKSRMELFNLVLNILQDGTGDLAAVDKSFSQMSVRNTKSTNHQTPKAAGKQKATATDYLSGLALSNLQNEAVPDLIAQRCLEALTYIVTSNESSSLFFLTEHELPVGLRRTVSKKGKGKEKQVQQTHYPIVLLLGLLDRQSLLKTPSIMESVVGLLATVTRPLTSLRDRKKDSEKEVESALGSSTAAPAQASADGPQAAPAAGAEAAPPVIDTTKDRDTSPELDEKVLLESPPQIPQNVMRLIVNILTIGECSGRTFQQSLALIQHLSFIPDARDIVAQELKAKAQEFGQSLYADLDELATALQDSEGDILASSVASKFSPASSDQAKLLRVLKTIDYMYSSKSISSPDESRENEDSEKVQGIYESFRFTPLWQRLGDCLAIIEQKPDTEHIATVLLPLIEALMVVCKYVGSKVSSTSSTRALRASASPRSPSTAKETMEDLFVTFTDAHRKVLNLMVRNNPSLMSGSFSLLVNNPRVLDFDNKRNYFTQQLHRRPHSREHHGTLQLNVRRARVFEDSFQHLQRKTGDQIKYGKLSVRFYDEEGVDAGGVTREWFQILARQMFDPNNALFQPCAADKLTYQPNKNSWVNPEHLSFFKFVGRVIGKAIYDGRLLDAYFARSLYRQLLGKPVDYRDVEWVDPEYYNSLCWILENDPTLLDLTFSVEADEFGASRIVPLKEGGESVPVTQENKREFVQLSAQYRLYSSIKNQIESLLGGFYEVIPKELVTIFNEQELELLISGTPDIDVDEWRAATEYNGYTSSDPVIVWWWRALKSFNRDERAKVLSFATGTSRVPLSGFVDLQGVQGVQRFSIHKAYGEPDRLPQAHTCFNQIDLPQYSSYEMLRQQLLMAINEGGEGFGFA